MRRAYGLLAGLAVILVAVGWLGSVRAGDGLRRTTTVVDGVPLTFVRPATGDGPYPGAVVVHGYAGSARLMQPFADTLVRNGYVVVLPDLAGHGASTRPLADPLPDVDTAVRSLRAQSDVDPDRIVLIGHSRGASAVTEYGGQHPDIAATVALSLGTAPAVLPRNLLVLYGQLEFFLAEPARQTLHRRAVPGETVTMGRTYGSIAGGTAVRAEAVPGVEHVGILYSPVTHEHTLTWLDDTVRPGAGGGAVHPLDRLWPAGLLLLGLLVGFVPVAGLVLRGVPPRPPAPPPAVAPAPASPGASKPLGPVPRDLVRSAIALAGGLLAGAGVGLLAPDPSLGFAVGGYLAMVVAAVGLAALRLAASRTLGWQPDPSTAGTTGARDRWRTPRVALLVGYATAMVVVPIQVGLTWVMPTWPRLVPLLASLAAAWLLFGAAERLGFGRWYQHALVLTAALGLLAALTVVGAASPFLLLVLPLLAALLGIGAGAAAVVRRFAVPWWLTAAVAAPPFAWVAATTFPLA